MVLATCIGSMHARKGSVGVGSLNTRLVTEVDLCWQHELNVSSRSGVEAGSSIAVLLAA
jgi:hypothetical protein